MIGRAKWLPRSVTLLVLVVHLSACTTCHQPINHFPSQPASTPTTQPAPRHLYLAIRDLQEAAYYCKRYHALNPSDRLGLKRLAEMCSALEEAGVEDENCQEAAMLVVEDQTDNGVGETRNSPATVLWVRWLEQVATAEPQHLVGQELNNGWTFLGYDVDEDRLIRGEPADLLLYWAGPVSASAGSEQDGWYRAGERWVQVLEGVHNLVLNGGFELGTEVGLPTGFPWDIYRSGPGTRRLVTDSRTGRRTAVALLDNTEVYSSTSFVSMWVPVNPDRLYLQAGWIKSVGGAGHLGRRWAGDIAEEACPYSYVVVGLKASDWQHHAGVVRPLEGADRCHLWLLNYRAVGQVYFDNVLFIEVGLPET